MFLCWFKVKKYTVLYPNKQTITESLLIQIMCKFNNDSSNNNEIETTKSRTNKPKQLTETPVDPIPNNLKTSLIPTQK